MIAATKPTAWQSADLLIDYFNAVYRPLRLRSGSDRTRLLYLNTLGNFSKFLQRPATLADLTDDTLNRFICWHRDKGNSPATCNKEIGQIMALWRYAARKRVVDSEPDVQLEKDPERTPAAWLDSEMRRLFNACQGERSTICGIPAPLWWQTLLLVFMDTAERVGAVMALTWGNVDVEGGWVTFPAETRKGRTRDRTFPLMPDTRDALRRIKPLGNDVVFPWPFTATHIYNRYKRILRRAGLPTDRKSKFHRLRRTSASFFAAAGGNPQELLDHTSRKTTKKYLDPRIVKAVNPADLRLCPGRDPVSMPVAAIPEPAPASDYSVTVCGELFSSMTVDTFDSPTVAIEAEPPIPERIREPATPRPDRGDWSPPYIRKHLEIPELEPLPIELEQFVAAYIRARVDLSPSEARRTEKSVRTILRVTGRKWLDELTGEVMATAISQFVAENGLTEKTRRNYASWNTQFVRWLVEAQGLPMYECLEALKAYRKGVA